jgi:hypothetical protein
VEAVLHPGTLMLLKSRRAGKKTRHCIILEAEGLVRCDYNEGGSARRKLMTAYRENA